MEIIEKYCSYCGKPLQRKFFPISNKYEGTKVFLKRKYCNRECMANAFRQNEKNGTSWYSEHKKARKLKKNDKCEICGSTQNVEIHHKNENWHDNSKDNLQALCRSCHMKLHKPKGTCQICGMPEKGYGYCNKHYIRYKKYGNPYLYYGKRVME